MAKKQPRAAESYPGARRNAVLRGEVKGTWPSKPMSGYAGPIYLNRSAKWRYKRAASTYIAARAISPYPERAVR